MKNPDIFQYNDPSAFLKEALSSLQMKKPHLTMRQIAKSLGLQNPSIFFHILQGRRHTNAVLLIKISEYLGLSEEEREFLQLLVNSKKAKDPQKKELFKSKIVKILSKKAVKQVDFQEFSEIKSWHYLAVLEALSLKEYGHLTNTQLSERFIPKLTPFEIQQAYDKLLQLDLIEPLPSSKNKYRRKSNLSLSVGRLIPNEAVRQYHDQGLTLARSALLQGKLEDRHFKSITLAITGENLAKINQKIEEFNEAILELGSAQASDFVYRVNIQGFKLTTG